MTVTAVTVALNIIYEGLVDSDVFIDKDEKVAFLKKNIPNLAQDYILRVQKPYLRPCPHQSVFK